MDISENERNLLIQEAKQALKKSYAPYSQFRVGSALLTVKGNIFTGCNIENSSYSLTICAERAAVASAIAHEGGHNIQIRAIAVATDPETPCSPCGACRQVLYEFGSEAIVLFQGDKKLEELKVSQLLPHGFLLSAFNLKNE